MVHPTNSPKKVFQDDCQLSVFSILIGLVFTAQRVRLGGSVECTLIRRCMSMKEYEKCLKSTCLEL